MSSQRIHYLDIAKGIAIIAVILGHVALRFQDLTTYAQNMVAICFSFHMPLFFMLSGYFIKPGRPFRWRKESRRLLAPYFACAAAIVALLALTTWIMKDLPTGMTFGEYVWDWVQAAIYGAGAVTPITLWPQVFSIGAIWFLWGLFWARLICTLAYQTRHPLPIVLIAFIVGLVSARHVFLPFSIQSGLCASLFVYAGSRLRVHSVFDEGRWPRIAWVGLLAVWIVAITRFVGFSMALADFGETPMEFVLNMVGAFAGTLCVVKFSQVIEHHAAGCAHLLEYLGTISLTILCVHIIEDNVIRWPSIIESMVAVMPHTVAFALCSVIRVVAICVVSWLVMKVPAIHELMAPSRKK